MIKRIITRLAFVIASILFFLAGFKVLDTDILKAKHTKHL